MRNELIKKSAGAGALECQILTSSGLCFLSQSFRAASMRVCQPLPVARNTSITSGEYRTVADFLVGSTDAGLPRRMTFLPSCKLAFSKNASSSSGASSGSTQVLFKSFNFAFISFPHRDNAARLIALRPDHNNKPGIQFTYGDESDLTVVLPVILAGKVNSGENFIASGKINTAFQQCSLSLALVEFNFHTIIVVTLINKSIFTNHGSWSYTGLTAAKSVVGRGNPEFITAHNRAIAVFLCVTHSFIQSMVGRAGQSSDWPGSVVTGISTPARLTTHKCGNFGGELFKFTTEVATMAATPAHARFQFIFKAVRRSNPSAEPVYLGYRANTERQARKFHEQFYELELIHQSRITPSTRPRIVREVSQ